MNNGAIRIVPGYDRQKDLGILFQEYEALLVSLNDEIAACLAMQNYDQELAHLEEKYGMPDGRLYVAYCNDVLAGCIALRRRWDDFCELKRVFVRPQFRGIHLGRTLLEKIICDAGSAGYRHMLLDTLPNLYTAISMYESFGFYRIGPYYDNPVRDAVYMQLDL